MKDNGNDIINQFKKSIWNLWAQDGENTWPIDLNSIIHLFIAEYCIEFDNDLRELEKTGVGDTEISKKLKTFGRIIRLTVPMIIGMKRMKLTIEDQHERIIRMLSLAEHLKHDDFFNDKGGNIILSGTQFHKLTENGMKTATASDSVMIHTLSSILYAFAEMLYFKTHGFVREFHGPYKQTGKEYLVRDYYDLNESVLWEELKDFKINNIRIVTAYSPLNLKVDIFSNLYIDKNSSYIPNLLEYKILVNGNQIEISDIRGLIGEIQSIMIRLGKKIELMDWKGLAKKYAEIFWFAKHNLLNSAMVPEKVIKQIQNGSKNDALSGISPEKLYMMLKVSL